MKFVGKIVLIYIELTQFDMVFTVSKAKGRSDAVNLDETLHLS